MKNRIDQALMLCGSRSFDTLDAYRSFVATGIAEHNWRHAQAIEIERAHLGTLPPVAPSTWEEESVRVTSASGFSFRHAFYTVPSRLIGHRLHLRVHDDRIEAYPGAAHMLTLPRTTTHVIDFRHVIGVLRAKPSALAGLTYRDAPWPHTAYRRSWEALIAARPTREVAHTMVGLLALAHDQGVEADLAAALDAILNAGDLLALETLRTRFAPKTMPTPAVHIEVPHASVYNPLLTGMIEEIAA